MGRPSEKRGSLARGSVLGGWRSIGDIGASPGPQR